MKLHQATAEIFVWDQRPLAEAISRTTHLAVCAHQDDIEILAAHGILECFHHPGRAFSGVVVTDGAGSARDYEYADYTDEQMKAVRRIEQKKAAFVGEFSSQFLLDHPSKLVKDAKETVVVDELARIIEATRPQVLYTHNLTDKHDTHVGVVLRTIAALRKLPREARPERVIGCEVWRDLDWVPDQLKVVMDVTRHENLQAALLGVFDSQIAGGKRYDLAALGRRKAHSTFSESHGVDKAQGLIYGVDLRPLVDDESLAPLAYVDRLLAAFREEVSARIGKLG
ncbi:MAG TPA: PIG-L family deacetylase [Polyangiaceae bacterium]|nr:PIG-L family deacetylase [Polyangiaceae bacterium]